MTTSYNKPPTLYTGKFSSGGVLQNELIPEHLQHLMYGVHLMGEHDPLGVEKTLTSLRVLFPIFKHFFHEYDKMYAYLDYCATMRDRWKQQAPNLYPELLSSYLYELYEVFWLAFNKAGLGIESQKYRSEKEKEQDRWKAALSK